MTPSSDPLPLDPQRILDCLGRLAPCFDVVVIPECASTNSVLMDAPPTDDGRVHVLVAENQTAGRGRRGRQWQSWPGTSLTLSTLWRFAPSAPVPAGLSLVAGIGAARAMESLGVHGVQLKWPNDILIGGSKAAGILVELLPGRAGAPAAVVGIGVNLRLPPRVDFPEQTGVTDLASHLAQVPDRNQLTATLLCELHVLFETYAAAGFGALRGAWQQRNAYADQRVRVAGEATDVTGLCAGVDEDGALLIRTEMGLKRILSGEVTLRTHP